MLKRILSLFRNLFRKSAVDQELEDELRSSVEVLTQEKMKDGVSQSVARREAFIELGGIEQVKEEVRAVRRGRFLEDFAGDVRYGLRQLHRSPGFTAVAVITLALGIGANTAIFSVVNGVLIRPLPYPESDRLVEVMRGQKSGNDETVEASKFLFWQQHSRVFETIAAYDIFGTGFNLASGGQPEHVTGIRVSADYFRVLDVPPAIGRGFTAEEESPGGANVAVISNTLWKQQLGGDQSIIGKTILLNDENYNVVGVMPAGFESRPSADILVPLRPVFDPQNDGRPLFIVLGRKSGDAQFRAITPDYFHAVRVPLLQGRYFTQAHNAQSQLVVIINEGLARQYFRDRPPVGEHLTITGGSVKGTSAVVGVVGDIREDGLDNPPPPTLFVPAAQLIDPFTRLMNKVVAASFVVRAKGAPMSVAADVQRELSACDGTVAAFSFRPMEDFLAGSIVRQRFNMLLLGTFAALALMLSAVGLYGVMSYAVTRRTHEFGIRMALGADQGDVLGLVVKQGTRVIAIGVALGIGLALLSTRLISSMLYGVRPTDPATLGGAILGLVVVAFLATYIPARRATNVDPIEALRYE